MADDPVLVITGASSRIGAATARRASEFRYWLALAARSEDKLERLRDELGDDDRAIAVRCDVTSWANQEALVGDGPRALRAPRRILRQCGLRGQARLPRGVRGALALDGRDQRPRRRALDPRRARPLGKREGRGHLLLTGSVAGRRALPGSLYSATKWAVTAMGENLRQEVAETEIKVTLIEPGAVDTPFFENRPSGALEPDDIARGVMFALTQPAHVDVNELLIRPIHQAS